MSKIGNQMSTAFNAQQQQTQAVKQQNAQESQASEAAKQAANQEAGSAFGELGQAAENAFNAGLDAVGAFFTDLGTDISGGVHNAAATVVNTFEGTMDALEEGAKGVRGWLSGVTGEFKEDLSTFADFLGEQLDELAQAGEDGVDEAYKNEEEDE